MIQLSMFDFFFLLNKHAYYINYIDILGKPGPSPCLSHWDGSHASHAAALLVNLTLTFNKDKMR